MACTGGGWGGTGSESKSPTLALTREALLFPILHIRIHTNYNLRKDYEAKKKKKKE